MKTIRVERYRVGFWFSSTSILFSRSASNLQLWLRVCRVAAFAKANFVECISRCAVKDFRHIVELCCRRDCNFI